MGDREQGGARPSGCFPQDFSEPHPKGAAALHSGSQTNLPEEPLLQEPVTKAGSTEQKRASHK